MPLRRLKDSAALLAAAALVAIVPASAQALEKVRFGTNWVAQGEHGGFYQSVVDGTYEACGLDVEILPGGPQVNNRALLLAGRIQFHMGGNMQQAFDARKEGIPVTVVGAIFQKEPQVIMTHPGQGLDKWEDLKGAKLILGDAGFNSYYQWMMAEFGFKAEQRVPYTYNPAPFIADPASGQQGYVTSEPFAIETQGGFKPNLFLIADYGYKTYSTTIEVMEPFLKEKPEAVKCFVEGSIKGWYNYLYGDPTEANKLIQQQNPDMSDEQIAYSREKLKEFGIIDSGNAETLGIGAMSAERNQEFYDQLVKAGVMEAGLDISKSFTTEFVNQGLGLDIKKKLLGE
ncbi:MAG: ABC transporter substrate-binding protein [Pseudomonadota bacterium]